jgi:hypothetical protein
MLGDAYWARPLVCTGVLADSVLAGSRLADWAGRGGGGGLLSRTPAPGTALKCRLCRLTRDRAAARQSGPMHAAPRQLGGFGCAARTSAAFTGAAAAAAELNPCARYSTEMRTHAHKGRSCWLTRCSVTGSSTAVRAYACSTQATWGLWVCSTHKCRLHWSSRRCC